MAEAVPEAEASGEEVLAEVEAAEASQEAPSAVPSVAAITAEALADTITGIIITVRYLSDVAGGATAMAVA